MSESFFFPLDRQLDLRNESYSPWVLERLEWAGANLESFHKGAVASEKLLGIEISAQGLRKLTSKLASPILIDSRA